MAAGSGKKQNEYLISPVVDLTGKTPTLSFDYLLFKYMIQNDIAKFTVEATINGGQTWTTIWMLPIWMLPAATGLRVRRKSKYPPPISPATYSLPSISTRPMPSTPRATVCSPWIT